MASSKSHRLSIISSELTSGPVESLRVKVVSLVLIAVVLCVRVVSVHRSLIWRPIVHIFEPVGPNLHVGINTQLKALLLLVQPRFESSLGCLNRLVSLFLQICDDLCEALRLGSLELLQCQFDLRLTCIELILSVFYRFLDLSQSFCQRLHGLLEGILQLYHYVGPLVFVI